MDKLGVLAIAVDASKIISQLIKIVPNLLKKIYVQVLGTHMTAVCSRTVESKVLPISAYQEVKSENIAAFFKSCIVFLRQTSICQKEFKFEATIIKLSNDVLVYSLKKKSLVHHSSNGLKIIKKYFPLHTSGILKFYLFSDDSIIDWKEKNTCCLSENLECLVPKSSKLKQF